MSSIERNSTSFESTAGEDSKVQILELIWRRKGLLTLTTIVAIGLGMWYYLEAPRVYESEALLLIKERQTAPVASKEIQLIESDKMETQMQTISSQAVLLKAAADPEFQKALDESFPSHKRATSLASGIKVGIVKNSDVLQVSFQSGNAFMLMPGDPKHATAALQAIVRAYENLLRDSYENVGEESAELIRLASENLNVKISEKRKAYAEFREKHAGDMLVVDGKATNVHSKRLQDLLAKRSELSTKRIASESELASAQAVSRSPEADNSAALDVLSKLNQLTGGAILNKKDVAPMEERSAAQLQAITELMLEEIPLNARYGEDHPRLKESQDKLELLSKINEQLENDRKEFHKSLEELLYRGHSLIRIPETPQECAEIYAGIISRDIARIDAELTALDTEIADAKEKSRLFDIVSIADDNFREEIRQAELLSQQVLARLDEINLIKDSGGTRAMVLNAPSIAVQVEPSLLKTIVVACFAGLITGTGIAYILEIGESTFRTPTDIVRSLNLPILGQVPSIDARRVKRSPGLTKIPQTIIAAHQPSSTVAESFRAIRTALYFSGEDKSHQVLQTTSPTPGDGKSTLSANLAVSIAKSGKRILLIDADFRRPTQHRIFGTSNELGLANYLSDTAPDATKIQPLQTDIENLWLLPAGPSVTNPSELLSGSKLGDVIDALRTRYDFVLIDTPPVLAVTDPLAVAARTDGVILVMRISRGIQFSSRRAKEAIDRVGGTILGVVVNGFSRNSTFARGVAKDYGYGYGYGYGQGYGGYSRNPYADPYARPNDQSMSESPRRIVTHET